MKPRATTRVVRPLQRLRFVQCIHNASLPVVTLKDGRTIRILEPIGRGSLATVYRAVLESRWRVQRPVAMKLLELPPSGNREEAMRHLARIARRSVCVRHPAVVQLFEVDRAEGIQGEPLAPFIVNELVDGESLATLVAGWREEGLRVPVDFALLVTLRATEALAAALFSECPDGSLTGLVHGDVSAREVLVSSQGEVKVSDFALAPLRSLGSRFSSLDRLGPMAPEVAEGAFPSPESDVFSLGAMLHELLVGPRFPDGIEPTQALQMVRRGEFHTSFLVPNLPTSLRAIIEQATAPNPMARYRHARAMASDLRREMLRFGLCDTQTCVRHAIVGWSGAANLEREEEPAPQRRSGIVTAEGKTVVSWDEPAPDTVRPAAGEG
jgi:serine/threonine protein kinase